MPSNSQRNQKKVFRVGTSGKARIAYKDGKPGKIRGALNGKMVHGVPHSTKKSKIARLSKSQKGPSVLLGSKLDIKNRDIVVEEAIKTKYGVKSLDHVDLRLKKYVNEALNRIE